MNIKMNVLNLFAFQTKKYLYLKEIIFMCGSHIRYMHVSVSVSIIISFRMQMITPQFLGLFSLV
jgi:hypothetical protein